MLPQTAISASKIAVLGAPHRRGSPKLRCRAPQRATSRQVIAACGADDNVGCAQIMARRQLGAKPRARRKAPVFFVHVVRRRARRRRVRLLADNPNREGQPHRRIQAVFFMARVLQASRQLPRLDLDPDYVFRDSLRGLGNLLAEANSSGGRFHGPRQGSGYRSWQAAALLVRSGRQATCVAGCAPGRPTGCPS